jgi:hypothetical protein
MTAEVFPFPRVTTPPFTVSYRPLQARQETMQLTPIIPTGLHADVEQPWRPSCPLPQPPQHRSPQLPSR